MRWLDVVADLSCAWLKGEGSSEWHPGYGGGAFLRVIATNFAFHGIVVHDDNANGFYVSIGLGL
jgi:hypothetical protein